MYRTVFAAALAFLIALPSHADTTEYRVLFGGQDVGAMMVEEEGREVEIDFDYKQNGRGPTMTETITLDERGYPVDWQVTGRTTFGNAVDEFYRYASGTGEWQDATGTGSGAAETNRFYIVQNGSFYSTGLLARALLADEDGEMDVFPGGTARIEERATLSFDGPDGPVEATTYEIFGLSTTPSNVTLDEQQRLFAIAYPRFSMIRAGYEEAADEALRAQAEELSTRRFIDIKASAARDYDGPVRIRNVRIFDPATLALTEARDVIVFGRRIASIEAANSPVTEGETVIDGAGGTLVPGMYEMHGHIGQENALLNIAAGVTSVRDMGNENDVLAGLIERIENGTIAGPRITRSGFIEGQSEFSAATGETVSTEEEAIDQVRWYAARGFPQVKLYNSMQPEWAPAVVGEAHRLGMRVAGHVPAFSTADEMIAAGFDEITHVNQLMLGWVLNEGEDTRTLFRFTAMQRFPQLDVGSEQIQSTIRSMLDNDVAHDPTIAIHELGLTAVNGEVAAGAVDIIDNMPVNTRRSYRQALFGTDTPEERDLYVAAFDKIVETLAAMHEAGVLLLPGTDLGGSFAYHRELELFQRFGMTPAQVLRRATLDMAEYMGQDEDLGSIEKGKYADFFLVAGDPTEDLTEIKRIGMVVSDGTVYFPSEIYPAFGITPFSDAPTIVEDAAADGIQ